MLNNARQNGSAHAKAIAENLKSKGHSFEQLVEKTAGTSDISDLPEEQRAKVATEIILSSGRTRPSVNTTTIAMDLGGKFIWAIEYALAFWAVIEADEKSRIAAREATTLAGGAIGAQIATTFAAAALAGAGLALTGLPAIILGIAVIILGGYLGAKLSQGVYDSIVEGKLWR